LFKFLAGVTTIAAAAIATLFCADENNSVNRPAMDALIYLKK
jgi:hypothetical protein